MTLQGPRLNAAPALPSLNPTVKPWIATIGGLALLGVAFVFWQHGKGRRPWRALRGLGVDLKTIARESRSAEDFARRAEAWNHGQAPRYKVSDRAIAQAYKKAKPSTMLRLIRDARQSREDGWASIVSQRARSLRGLDVTEKQQRMFKRGVEAMKRAMKGTPDIDRAFNVAIRGSKDPDFAAGVRNAWNRVHPSGNREAAEKSLVKYGFKAG